MPSGVARSRFDTGRRLQDATLLHGNEDEDYASVSSANESWESDSAEDDALTTSTKRRQYSTVRLLIVDTVPAVLLHKNLGPSLQVNMLVRVRFVFVM